MIYFIRHGETDWNRERRFQGQRDIPLNETGRSQARAYVTALEGKGITHVVSSPLKRAFETAHIIANALSIPITQNPDLMEINFGDFEGLTREDIQDKILPDGTTGAEVNRRHKSIDPQYDDTRNPGGESKREVRVRINRALRAIADTADGDVLVVMHNAAFRIFMAPIDTIQAEEKLEHDHIVRMKFAPDAGFKVIDRLRLDR